MFPGFRGAHDWVMSAAPQRWEVVPQLEVLDVAPPSPAPAPRISFIVPVFNESRTIGEVLDRVDDLGIDAQVIVVDDGGSPAGGPSARISSGTWSGTARSAC